MKKKTSKSELTSLSLRSIVEAGVIKKPAEDIVYQFAGKVARAMKHLSSSHVYFVLQTAFDPGQTMDWCEVDEILKQVINQTKVDWQEPRW